MAYTTDKEPYTRLRPPAQPESTVPYIDEELRKIEVSLDRILTILDEIDARLNAGGL
jgi:hypothetical protein